MIYKVYFQIYGKKMMANVSAKSAEQAKATVKAQLIIRKVETNDATFDKAEKECEDILKFFK